MDVNSVIFLSPEKELWKSLAGKNNLQSPNSTASPTSSNSAPVVDSPESPENAPIHHTQHRPDIELLQESISLHSYQLYIVEQWVPQRKYRIKTIVVYTGDKSHEIQVCVVRADKSILSSIQQQWMMGMEDKSKWMDVSVSSNLFSSKILVTNLGNFPSHLNIIHVPTGNIDQENMVKFILNLNLRKLACSGRSSLTLTPPSDAQKDRFHQIYKTNSSLTFAETVTELIKLAQAALFLLGILPEEYIDGLLCDETCEAIGLFQERFGPFEGEIKGSQMDPVLCASLLSKIVIVRNRLNAMGDQCPKNVFQDREGFMTTIAMYQKSHKLEPTGILDMATLERIDESYTRTSPPLKVHKVLKSKIDDISGHHNSPMDTETSDLDFLGKHTNIDTFRHLWGRRNRTAGVEVLLESANIAEGLIQGGKELGRNILKNVKGPRVAEKYRDGGSNMMKGIRTGVAESITKFSNSVEGFVDRKLVSKLQRISPTKMTSVGLSEESLHLPPLRSISGSVDVLNNSGDSNGKGKCPQALLGFHSVAEKQWDRRRKRANSLGVLQGLPRSESWNNNRTRVPTDPSLFLCTEEYPSIKENVEAIKEGEMNLSTTVEALKAISKNFDEMILEISTEYASNWKDCVELEKLLNNLIEQNKQVQIRIESLESKSSKLQYEVSALDDKVRETDEIFSNFHHKIQEAHQQVNIVSAIAVDTN